MKKFDAAIAGGGVIGGAIALELARGGLRVAVFGTQFTIIGKPGFCRRKTLLARSMLCRLTLLANSCHVVVGLCSRLFQGPVNHHRSYLTEHLIPPPTLSRLVVLLASTPEIYQIHWIPLINVVVLPCVLPKDAIAFADPLTSTQISPL